MLPGIETITPITQHPYFSWRVNNQSCRRLRKQWLKRPFSSQNWFWALNTATNRFFLFRESRWISFFSSEQEYGSACKSAATRLTLCGNYIFETNHYCLLPNRKQRVRIGNTLSQPLPITLDVLQGFVMLATLFLIFSNDLLELNVGYTESQVIFLTI